MSAPLPTSPVERMAEAMREKGAWCGVCDYGETLCGDPHPEPCVECVRITEGYARAALGALQGEGMEEAVEAACEEARKFDAEDKWHTIVTAIAPILLAQPLAQLAQVTAENQRLREALKEIRAMFFWRQNPDRKGNHEVDDACVREVNRICDRALLAGGGK